LPDPPSLAHPTGVGFAQHVKAWYFKVWTEDQELRPNVLLLSGVSNIELCGTQILIQFFNDALIGVIREKPRATTSSELACQPQVILKRQSVKV
jgi:hypothetical protein